MSMVVPRDLPAKTDFYYVLESAWDDAASYDQLGFTAGSGVWGVAYSTTTPCASSYSFVTDAYNLTGGTQYTFKMDLEHGSITFLVSLAGGTTVWSHSVVTGGSGFVISGSYTCATGTSLDLTDYEEVYDTIAPVPPYVFGFASNLVNGQPESDWVEITGGGAPLPVATAITGSNVTVQNEPYGLGLAGTFPTELSSSVAHYRLPVQLVSYGTSTAVALSYSGVVIGANASTVAFSPSSGTTPFLANLTLTLLPLGAGAGSYPIEVVAKDASGRYAELSVVVVVAAPLNATVPVTFPPSADVNQSVSFSEIPNGGVRPYRFVWAGLPDGCTGPSGYFTCHPAAPGNYTVSVTLVDALGVISTSPSMSLVIAPALRAALSANRTALDVGQLIGFSLELSGGSGGDLIAWSGGGPACVPAGRTDDCLATSAAVWNVSVTVTDSNGATVVAASPLVPVSADPVVSLAFDRAQLDLGMSFMVRATVTGGAGGVRIGWTGLPADCPGANASAVTCRTGTVGDYAVGAGVVDANGFANVSRALVIIVNPDPSVRIVSSASSLLAGDGVAFTAELSGGSGGWTYAWSGLPAGCPAPDGPSLSCSPGDPGTYRVHVVVIDVTGTNASATANLTVAPELFGLPQLEGVGIILVVIASVALATALAVRGRRRPPR
jgi:hypothetical protein